MVIIIAFCLYCRNFCLDCDARTRDAGRHAWDCVDRILSNGCDDVDARDAVRRARVAFDRDASVLDRDAFVPALDAFVPAVDASGDRDDFVAAVGRLQAAQETRFSENSIF